MTVFIKGNRFGYELANIARLFFRDVTVEERSPAKNDKSIDYAYLRLVRTKDSTDLFCVAYIDARPLGNVKKLPSDACDKECEHELACLLYDMLCSIMGKSPKWGVITGIRPAKYAAQLFESGLSEEEILWRLETRHRVNEDKAKLCVSVSRYSRAASAINTKNSCSLYVSIPFCPSRCSYCSFISKSVERDRQLIEPYIKLLCEEIKETSRLIKSLGLRLETVYIGGGTPTVLTAAELSRLCATINECFDIKAVREFSVEAGRPDTVNLEKLAVLKDAGVTRLSINPQTSNDEVLRLIGRKHTAGDIERCFCEAREAGFDNINADLIAGLPYDDIDSFKHTLSWVKNLSPENITVHALTLKRASSLTERRFSASPDAGEMVDYATETLMKTGYLPYYMYKQKGTVDGLENTGYTLLGKECLYNIFIMEELHTIFACGAGGVTKIVDRDKNLIERIYNYKYPIEYINNFGEILKRKKGVTEYYGR